MRQRGKLAPNADPATLATATTACLQGSLLLTEFAATLSCGPRSTRPGRCCPPPGRL